jgi:hypothetical protein
MRRLTLLVAFAVAPAGQATETHCLRDILYAEARGESIEHVAGLGQAAIVKASHEKKSLCQLPGVNRRRPKPEEKPYFELIANHLLRNHTTSITRGADHWNTGVRPRLPGKVTRQLGNHVFYTLVAPAEKH